MVVDWSEKNYEKAVSGLADMMEVSDDTRNAMVGATQMGKAMKESNWRMFAKGLVKASKANEQVD